MLEDLIVAAHRDAKTKIEASTAGGDAKGHRRIATASRNETPVLGWLPCPMRLARPVVVLGTAAPLAVMAGSNPTMAVRA